MENNAADRARHVAAPIQYITLKGVKYPAIYNNKTARICEDIYADVYCKDIGYANILVELSRGRYSAIMAMLYAAIVSGGSDMTFQEFDEIFSLDAIDGLKEKVLAGVTASLPQEEENPKNP